MANQRNKSGTSSAGNRNSRPKSSSSSAGSRAAGSRSRSSAGTKNTSKTRSHSGEANAERTHNAERQSNRPSDEQRRRQATRMKRKQAEAYRAKRQEYWVCVLVLFSIVLFLNVLGRTSPRFCDWYASYVLPIWINVYGRVTSLLPFSLGEWMIIAAVILTFAALVLWIPACILKSNGSGQRFRFYVQRYYRFYLVLFLDVALVMTLNCFILYNRTPLDPNPNAAKKQYSVEEVYLLREYIVSNVNELSAKLPRDNNGMLVYDGDFQKEAVKALKGISEEYPLLDGWMPKVKNMNIFSHLLSQSYICGYYFPFSMEANVNPIMYLTNFPECYCHELSHVRGFIYEDEANYIAYLACIGSEDAMFRYSGYLSVLWYVEEALDRELQAHPEFERPLTPINDMIYNDDQFLTAETWEEVESGALVSTETVEHISDTITDTELKLNGVESGIQSYAEVVKQLLRYYDGTLY
ncbi:MAG: DUF3810 domain-containing protein [Lachnospiraceae bacterium]|nr:DUF3810 domain-containing protein [Lachnospiraceae bacterium]